MSWTGDIRCLYCDGKLPLLRKITSGQFCSVQHRKLYWEEQERLGVERLHQTHNSLMAVKPAAGAEQILGKLPGNPPVATATVEGPPACRIISKYTLPAPCWPPAGVLADAPEPCEVTGRVRLPLRPSIRPLIDRSSGFVAGVAKVPIAARNSRAARKLEPIAASPQPHREVFSGATPSGDAFAPIAFEAEMEDVPEVAGMVALARITAKEYTDEQSHREPWSAAPFAVVKRPHLPIGRMGGARRVPGTPPLATLLPLEIERVPLVHGTWIDNLRAVVVLESPRYELSTPALRPRLKLAAGSRYPVATRDLALPMVTKEPESVPAGNMITIPERKAMAAAASAGSAPNAAGWMPMASLKANEPTSPRTAPGVNLPQPLKTEPVRPASHLEPIDAIPAQMWMPPPQGEQADREAAAAPAGPPQQAHNAATLFNHVYGFWKHAPRDLKLMVFGIPILLGLALHPTFTSKKISYTAPPQHGSLQQTVQQTLESKWDEQWKNVRQSMVDRAAIALDEDFRTGLDDWTSRGGTTEWEFDATGFVKPGPLALYRPSVDLTDYQMQFLGMIDKKALSWVVRAADFDDYYVVKLVILKPGPVPTVGLTRYAVIHGVAQDRADTTAYINAREDMLYRVRMDIHGDVFTLTVQGQVVDSWTEPRLRKGGVGFFTARGEASRLRWVQVTHQYDMLGRLCAYLAPYNIPSTSGGWQP
jgi:hypothetical protein